VCRGLAANIPRREPHILVDVEPFCRCLAVRDWTPSQCGPRGELGEIDSSQSEVVVSERKGFGKVEQVIDIEFVYGTTEGSGCLENTVKATSGYQSVRLDRFHTALNLTCSGTKHFLAEEAAAVVCDNKTGLSREELEEVLSLVSLGLYPR